MGSVSKRGLIWERQDAIAPQQPSSDAVFPFAVWDVEWQTTIAYSLPDPSRLSHTTLLFWLETQRRKIAAPPIQ